MVTVLRRRDEELPPGGAKDAGAEDPEGTVRAADTVLRPAGLHTSGVHALLRHLEAVGFDGTPRVYGIDGQDREVLEFIPGDIAASPYPAWVATDSLLDSVADLQRRYFLAARTFVPPHGSVWADIALPDEARGPVVCHTDLCVENIVVRDGRAVAMIDFDCACPVNPLYDLSVAARHWVPLRDPVDLDPARAEADQSTRFARFCDGHRLTRAERERVLTLVLAFLDVALSRARANALAGHGELASVSQGGYEAANRRARDWVVRNRRSLLGRV